MIDSFINKFNIWKIIMPVEIKIDIGMKIKLDIA